MGNEGRKPTGQLMKNSLQQTIITKRKTNQLIDEKPLNPVGIEEENQS